MARRLNVGIALPLAVIAGCLLAVGFLTPAPARRLASRDQGVPSSAAASVAASAEAGSLTGITLGELQKAFGQTDPRRARDLAARLLQATAADAEQLHGWLHRRTGIAAEDFKSVLRAVGAAVPDRLGRFSASEKDFDWLDALLQQPVRLAGGALRRARGEAALSVALMRGLAASRHPEASLSLLRFAYRHQGAFRDEAGRQIRSLGPHAVPGMLRASALKDPEAHRMLRYAAYQLDRIDCARPDRALKQADPELRVEILHAYGETRTPVAVSAVLAYSNDPVETVRRAARWAMLRYVSGRPPKVVKRKLKLPGGKETDKARALYLTYRQLATHALVERLAADLSGATEGKTFEAQRRALGEEAEPRYLAEKLFARFDKQRTELESDAFRAALASSRKGNLDEALARFDKILASDPYHGQREAMAPLYFTKGCSLLAAGRLLEAETYLTKAIHLRPGAPFVRQAQARIALAEALADTTMGSESEWKLRTALRLDPGLSQAALALQAFEKRQQQRLWWASGIGGGIALAFMIGIALLRRRLAW